MASPSGTGHDTAEQTWLIERPGSPGRPDYWRDSDIAKGLGSWTDDPWLATRYESQKDAERELRRWQVHPAVPIGKAVSHGFVPADRVTEAAPAQECCCPALGYDCAHASYCPCAPDLPVAAPADDPLTLTKYHES